MRSIKQVLQLEYEVPTVVEGLLLTDYLALPRMSGSPLTAPSMKHLRTSYETVAVVTDPMRIGSAVDSLLFDSMVTAIRDGRPLQDALDEYDEEFPVFTGKKRAGDKWSEFHAEHGEHYFRSYHERQQAVDTALSVATDATAATYWTEGLSQLTLLTSENGILLKQRPDWIATERAIVDLKTTADLTRCSQTVRRFGYHRKMALYQQSVKRCFDRRLPCVLIFGEQQPPHDVVVMTLDQSTLDKQREIAYGMLKQLRRCIHTDQWPGVANGEEQPYEPSYEEMEEVYWEDTEVVEV